jgi:hypothetical protein
MTKSKVQQKPQADDTFTTLTENALKAVNGFASGERSRLTQHTNELYSAIAEVVAVRYVRELYPVEYGTFIIDRGVFVPDSKISKPHVLIQALFNDGDRKDFAARISIYGQTVSAIETLGIPVGEIANWMATPEELEGVKLTGLAKARAHFRIQNGKVRAKPGVSITEDTAPLAAIRPPVDVETMLTFDNVRLYIGRTDEEGNTEIHPIDCNPNTLLHALGLLNPMAIAA